MTVALGCGCGVPVRGRLVGSTVGVRVAVGAVVGVRLGVDVGCGGRWFGCRGGRWARRGRGGGEGGVERRETAIRRLHHNRVRARTAIRP